MTTNYKDTFITIAPDSPTMIAVIPPQTAKPTIALLQYALLSARPYELTSDDLLFEIHVVRSGTPEQDRDSERERFFARDQACLRASPLPKRYGWGIHHDHNGRVALLAAGTTRYDDLAQQADTIQIPAMRSSRQR